MRALIARAVAALRTRTEEIAAGLLDDMTGHDARGASADLIDDYAALLPATVIAEMLGAPVEMRRQFLEWGAGGALSLDAGLSWSEFRRSESDLTALADWMVGHFEHIRRHPGDNILSTLVHAHSEEGRLSDELSFHVGKRDQESCPRTPAWKGSGARILVRSTLAIPSAKS